uniref:Major Facilitator Superfamily protein n=1 Tax=Candidatus Kentrum sp. FW TaxID=2126338 RepID=A0A450U379_9GAMM|nr:MAG: Major Facilitator Superfamily protein [Candidatus Kentron sp. FW]
MVLSEHRIETHRHDHTPMKSSTDRTEHTSFRAERFFVNTAHFADHLFMLIFPTAVLSMGADFGLSYSELLSASLGGFIAFGAGSLPAGWFGDHWSRRNMLGIFFIGIGMVAIFTGLARSWWGLAAGLTGVGLFASIYHPIGTAMLVAGSTRLGRDIGFNGVCGNLGVASAALVTGILVHWLGWRWAFILPGMAIIGMGFVFLARVKHRPLLPAASDGGGTLPGPGPRHVIVVIAVIAATALMGGITFNGATISLPKLFDERIAFLAGTPMGTGLLVSVVFLVGALSQLFVGRLIDRFPLKRIFVAFALLQAPFLLLAIQAEDGGLLVAAALIIFAVFGQVTLNDAMVGGFTPDAWRARAYALRYFISSGASGIAVALISTIHGQYGSFDPVLLVLSGCGALLFLTASMLPGTRTRP